MLAKWLVFIKLLFLGIVLASFGMLFVYSWRSCHFLLGSELQNHPWTPWMVWVSLGFTLAVWWLLITLMVQILRAHLRATAPPVDTTRSGHGKVSEKTLLRDQLVPPVLYDLQAIPRALEALTRMGGILISIWTVGMLARGSYSYLFLRDSLHQSLSGFLVQAGLCVVVLVVGLFLALGSGRLFTWHLHGTPQS